MFCSSNFLFVKSWVRGKGSGLFQTFFPLRGMSVWRNVCLDVCLKVLFLLCLSSFVFPSFQQHCNHYSSKIVVHSSVEVFSVQQSKGMTSLAAIIFGQIIGRIRIQMSGFCTLCLLAGEIALIGSWCCLLVLFILGSAKLKAVTDWLQMFWW